MNTGINLKFDNKYNLKLIDSRTGNVKQEGTFSNIAVAGMKSVLADSHWCILYQLACGSGTTAPSSSDTALASPLWNISNSNVSNDSSTASKISYSWIDKATIRGTRKFIFPANSSYVGTVTEVGLRAMYTSYGSLYNAASLATRALLTDSEGQQISFTKTDIDILEITVTVEVSISSSDSNFTIFDKPFLLYNIVGPTKTFIGNSFLSDKYSYLNLYRYYYDCENQPFNTDSGVGGYDLSVSNSPTGDTSGPYISYATKRVESTTITSERYYHAIVIPGLGYWKLPNENVFPAYTITGLNIGTGDGTTVSFTNPINYFKAGTEKVYKNGVQLTRDTDYTINNVGNKDCLPEVTQLLNPSSIKSDISISTSYVFYPLFRPSNISSTVNQLASGNIAGFNNTYPAYIEYEEEVTLNCLRASNLVNQQLASLSSYTTIPTGTVFYVDASDDGITYNEVASHTTTDTTGSFSLDFADTTAKYWRVRTTLGSSRFVAAHTSNGAGYLQFSRKDPYIVFTTAPADGDVLTMDVDMDVIMKNSNFVIDISARVDFTV